MQVVLAPSIRIAQDGVGVADGAELLGGLRLAVASVAVGMIFQGELAVALGNDGRVVALGAAEDGVEVLRRGWRCGWRSGWRRGLGGGTVGHRRRMVGAGRLQYRCAAMERRGFCTVPVSDG